MTALSLWYIVPIGAVVSHQHLRFYPNGKGHNSRLEKYREAGANSPVLAMRTAGGPGSRDVFAS
ncbi:MAG TPA: hypothetical protein VEI49_09385 [Terriglobales bacterium]|nr:hypothetical protein [Terriglobales bacterium]